MKLLNALFLSSLSVTGFAGTMGDALSPVHLIMLGGGAAYDHAFYKSYIPAESNTIGTPGGVRWDAGQIFPNDFWGAYINVSFYTHQLLFNAKYELYDRKNKTNDVPPVTSTISPARFSLSVDRVWGDVLDFSYGVGAGFVHESINEGNIKGFSPSGFFGGSTINTNRLDPLVEGFVMKQIAPNWNVKFNAGYQIPANSQHANGDLLLNLGVNYLFAI